MEYHKTLIPAALSFIFRPFIGENIWNEMHPYSYYSNFGSTGVGCTINRHLSVTASKSKREIIFNGQRTDFPTVETALKFLTDESVGIKIQSPLPAGWGFGISGASALGALLSVNGLLQLNIKKTELYKMAHAAEIAEKTGLGTVATLVNGGMLIKKKPGIPSVLKRLNFEGQKIHGFLLGPIKTDKMLGPKQLEKINGISEKFLAKAGSDKELTLAKILDISFEFCLECDFPTRRVREIISAIKSQGGSATMNIFGEVILSNIPFNYRDFPHEEFLISNGVIHD